MTTVLKAVPEQPVIEINNLNENIRFFGNDVEKITIVNVQYGRTIILEEFDSLKEINVKKSGAILSFNYYPNQTIRINGAFEEIRVQDQRDNYSVHRFGSNPTLPLEGVWGAVITSDTEVQRCGEDVLMIKTQDINVLNIKEDYSHISVIGDRQLKSIQVEGKRTIKNFTVHKGLSLYELFIRRRSLTCSLIMCPNISSVMGFGDRLNLKSKPVRNSVVIGGFWHKVPAWYDLQLASLRIPHFNPNLNSDDISNCEDMGGITITPYNYDGKGGLCHFESAFGIDLETIASGIEISEMVKLIEKSPADGFRALKSWSESELSLFDQYKVMRILASLISRGFSQKQIINLRNIIAEMNARMPKLILGSVNDGNQGGKWKQLYSGDSEEWEIPSHSVMPFRRIDLEIWLNTNLSTESLGLGSKGMKYQYVKNQRWQFGKNVVARNSLVPIFAAANSSNRNDNAELKLTQLIRGLLSNQLIIGDPFCCEFFIFHLNNSRINTKTMRREFVNSIVNMTTNAWKKVALLVAVVDQTDSPRARMALKRLASDKEFTAAEASIINAISISGRKSFGTSKVAKPEWPYLSNWYENMKNRRR